MRTLLYAGVVHRACEVCSEKWPCAKHPEKRTEQPWYYGSRNEMGRFISGVASSGRPCIEHHSCPDCGYHVCSCSDTETARAVDPREQINPRPDRSSGY